jgi:hypothetical protein
VRKYATDAQRDTQEQLYNNREILFDLSNFRRPVEVRGKIGMGFLYMKSLGNNWKKYSKNFKI